MCWRAMFNLKSIPDNISGKRVLLRADLNSPIVRGRVSDDFRLLKTLPTIRLLSRKGAKVILISHFERGGKFHSLRKVAKILERKIKKFKFVDRLLGPKAEKTIKNMSAGDVLLLENLRLHPGEKNNDAVFAKQLAGFGDIYINEAFSASHRKHASVVGITKFLPSYAGPLFKEEVKNLSLAFNPPHPFTLIVGGNKLETKIPLIKKFLKKADRVVVGGALAASFLYGKEKKLRTPKIILPKDAVTEHNGRKVIIDILNLGKRDVIYDLGPKSMKEVAGICAKSSFILWNGPLGFIERGHVSGTLSLVRAINRSKGRVIAGGGDTAAFLRSRNLTKGFYFISTAGGAMLDFLVHGTLPGIEALKRH